MAPRPPAITIGQRRARARRVTRIARHLGFVGRVEYRHVYSDAGGAQYGRGRSANEDLLIVFAEAFERDSDPEDFSLTAILAHERGHQILVRHPRIAVRVAGRVVAAAEEILASLLGALICDDKEDRDNLIAKAAGELLMHGQPPANVVRQLRELRDLFEALL